MSKLKVGKSYFFLGHVHQPFVSQSGGAVALPLRYELCCIFSGVCLAVSQWHVSFRCCVKLIPVPWHAPEEVYMKGSAYVLVWVNCFLLFQVFFCL